MITFKKTYKDLTKEECCQILIHKADNNSKLVEDKFAGKEGETVLISEHNHNRLPPLSIKLSDEGSDLVVIISYTPMIQFLLCLGLLVKTTFFFLLYLQIIDLAVDVKIFLLYPLFLVLYSISILSLYVRSSEYFNVFR